MEETGYSIADSDAFVRRVQHVEYGLSAEIEFGALLRWLGACPFVHRLSEDLFRNPTRSEWQVPDLFAVFQNGNLTCTAMIEVKTTSNHTLRLKTNYLARLQAYAELTSQPLLLAWRPRDIGFWILVDPCHAKRINDDTLELNFESAVKNDLMSIIAGDFCLVPKKGAGLIFEATRIGEKRPMTDGYQAAFRIDNAYFRDGDGNPVSNLPNAIVWTLFSVMEEEQNVSDGGLVQAFVASGGMTRAQQVLRTAASFPLSEDQRIHWKAIGTNLDAVVSSRDLLSQAKTHIGTFVRYIFHEEPASVPQFLPRIWKFN